MRALALLVVIAPLTATAAESAPAKSETAPLTVAPPDAAFRRAIDAASCTGEYADEGLALSTEARELERRPESNYSYCLRNTAVYECLSYGSDGKVRRKSVSVLSHGTAFAYKTKGDDSFLLTNEHVASWPLVTDEEHPVEDVPPGCKKVDEQLRLVRDEGDDYEPGQIAVQRVVTDPYLDAAVLKVHHQLNVLPYRVGRSALLRAGNIVQIRGYPLGKMQATNSGKVVTPYDLDREKSWNHVDFVTDALVTKGNSGSPVFAISCRTGSLELVGLYHAGYRGSPAMNVVVGIDQLHDLMENLRRSKPPTPDPREVLGPTTHATILAALKAGDFTPFFAVGDRVARLRSLPNGRIAYDIFGPGFPSNDAVEITLEEIGDAQGGALDQVTLSSPDGVRRSSPLSRLDAETQDALRGLFDLSRHQLLLTLSYRASTTQSEKSRESFRRAKDLSQQMDGHKGLALDLLHTTSELATRLPAVSQPIAEGTPTPARPPGPKQ